VTAALPPCEVAWFGALCDDDYEFLGVPDPALASSWSHCRDIVLAADRAGYDNVLLPSGYALGIDTTVFAAAVAPLLTQIRLLMAVRAGEEWPPQLARRIATLDRLLGGRLTVNIISSDLPGEALEGAPRYRRTVEVMHILRTLLSGQALDVAGEFYRLRLDPPRVTTVSGRCPPLYFGGLSPLAREAAAEAADVYLMWPDTMPMVRAVIADLRARAAAKGRRLRFGYRVHVIVRETESEARAYARRLLSRLDGAQGEAIRGRSLDAASAGVQRQAALREEADDEGFVEPHLWTGIGRARSGCGAAIVGDPDQVLAKLEAYRAEGLEAFILSGYPHRAECDLFARYVLPRLDHAAGLAREASLDRVREADLHRDAHADACQPGSPADRA
jgi:alkanesulfonate monooxygenase